MKEETQEIVKVDVNDPDFILTGGVVERRVNDEVAMYDRRLAELTMQYQNSVAALNAAFTSRVRAIANDPFVKFDPPSNGNGSSGGPSS